MNLSGHTLCITESFVFQLMSDCVFGTGQDESLRSQAHALYNRKSCIFQLMSDYVFGTGQDESLRSHALYNRTYSYVFNYKSRYDYLPPWRGRF